MPKESRTFETALSRLEEIVDLMEAGDITLDDSIKALEEGNELVKFCLNKLDDAEKKIEKLNTNSKGNDQ